MKFDKLQVNSKILDAIAKMGFEDMTPIQEKSIPLILEGKNLIGEAHTGTGKTAAFGLPLFEIIEADKNEIQVLIMAPTRELSIQIVDELKKIGKNYNYDIVALVGGMSIEDQNKALKKFPKIIVATPGRLVDHLNKRRLSLSKIKAFVLDEVDEMIKVGFKEEIDKIIELLPEQKQTLLFSATISDVVKTIANTIGNDFEIISVTDGNKSTDNITQYCVITKESNKFPTLINLLDIDNPKLAIVFGRTKRRADELNTALTECGYKVAALHGDLSQAQRNAVLRKFKNNEINILVATDVAARGLDVTGVTHVYNFDLPQEVEYYIHRIGRTGRANNCGISYTFARETEIPHIEKITKETNAKIEIMYAPSDEQVKKANGSKLINKIDNAIENKHTKDYKDMISNLLEKYSDVELAMALIELNLTKRSDNNISLTGEPPVKMKKVNNNNNRSSRGSFGRRNNNRKDGFRKDKNNSGNNRKDSFRKDNNNRDKGKWRSKSFDKKSTSSN